jgi:hypothetical protein
MASFYRFPRLGRAGAEHQRTRGEDSLRSWQPADNIAVTFMLWITPDRRIRKPTATTVSLKMGADDFIRKPFSHRLVVECVKVLLRRAYDEDVYLDDRTIDSHIKRLRRKFSNDVEFDMVETLYCIGHRFKEVWNGESM